MFHRMEQYQNEKPDLRLINGFVRQQKVFSKIFYDLLPKEVRCDVVEQQADLVRQKRKRAQKRLTGET